ncbi:MAG: FAD-dependent oxidoreductase [Armatimonadetes bacterium]|nr:FAD-dependent oxidoreductase [Armatimonadota bacterium]
MPKRVRKRTDQPMQTRKFPVEIPDVEYYQRMIKCQQACPAHTCSGAYVQKIAEGDYLGAYILARTPNPFASVCGRVCGAPCEAACRRSSLDEPVSIRALKRFVTERFGVETHPYNPSEILDLVYDHREREAHASGRKIAVVGSGPAGLSCAHELALAGFAVTVFDSQPIPGGMMSLGLPEYRLPRKIVELEIAAILHLGVQIQLEKALGTDFSLDDLRDQGYEAVFLACGATKSRELQLDGIELDGVLKGIDFLLNANLGYSVHVGESVIVVGGGNVAVDVARTALRFGIGIEDYRTAVRMGEIKDGVGIEERSSAVDIARLALRRGAKHVRMVCLESRGEMPAYEWEVQAAIEEGIELFPSVGPKRILGHAGKVVGIETLQVASIFDKNGRFNPSFVEGSEAVIEGDTVILAIGHQPDLTFLSPEDAIAVSPRGTIEVDPETLETSRKSVFAGGDVTFGPRLLIDAVADGKRAAQSIKRFLGGKEPSLPGVQMSVIEDHHRYPGYDRIPRAQPGRVAIEKRIGISEVEVDYDETTAIEQARRCLKCQIQTVFDSEKCILCGGCVDVCPEYCLRLTPVGDLTGDQNLMQLLQARYEVSADSLRNGDLDGTAIIKDEDRCIRCGLCAERCPTGAITMEYAGLLEDVS